jgi:4-diphosphocytidyl-2-C-methyl-D-erythritol kinase
MAQLTELRNLVCPAKINWFLEITGRRADGYHLLQTVFQFISLVDQMDVVLRQDGQIVRHAGAAGVKPEQDLTVRAARLLQRHTHCALGCEITVRKAIPMGGGLGGGSANAALVLLALNRLWQLGLSRHVLADIGLQLGADVPVFVHGSAALATGVGEILQPVVLPPSWLLLVRPPVSVPTASAFGAAELKRNSAALPAGWPKTGSAQATLRACLGRANNLQTPVANRYPAVASALHGLCQLALDLKLSPEHARMSGSGSCVFLPFSSAEVAQKALALWRQQHLGLGRVWLVHTLPHFVQGL